MSRRCFLARFDHRPCVWRLDGQPDQAHLIPAQRLRAAKVPDDDPRLLVPLCRRHHRALDGFDALNKITLTYEDFPEGCHDFAREYGFDYSPERGWRRSKMPRDLFTSTVEGAAAYEEQRAEAEDDGSHI